MAGMRCMVLRCGLLVVATSWAATVPEEGTPEHPMMTSQTFVRLFEWSWDDVAKECETFLGPKGYIAALVSPPNEHIVGDSWWTRYQPVSYNLTSRSGTEEEFIDMIRRCREVGVGIYVDAVINHMASGSGVGVAGSTFGNRTYPPYSPEDFHHLPGDVRHNCQITNYMDKQNVQNCDLVGLPDLCIECEHVQDVVSGYLNHLRELGVAGFRVDAAKHIDAGDMTQLMSKVDSSLFRYQEVIGSAHEAVNPKDYLGSGAITEMGFKGLVYSRFVNNNLQDDLAASGESWGLVPSDRAILFLDTHDSQRDGSSPLTHRSGDLYYVVSSFMLAIPYGFAKIMSSYAFESFDQPPPSTAVHNADGTVNCGDAQPWVCEHRRLTIANMVAWRRTAGSAPISAFVANGDTLAFCRGALACIAINLRPTTWETELAVTMPPGAYCDVIRSDYSDDCPEVQVESKGVAVVQVPPLGVVAFHVKLVSKSQGVLFP